MPRVLTIISAALIAGAALAQDTGAVEPATQAESAEFAPIDAGEADLTAFRYLKRPVVVFADTDADPAFDEQLRFLSARWPELAERDVVVIVDTDPAANAPIRTKLRPRGFMLVLIDKDGQVALRKPFPWDARELMRAIDRMPDRREELRNRRAVTE